MLDAGAVAGEAAAGAGSARASGTAAGRCCSCATACSEYGSLIAFGSVLNVGVLGRPLESGTVAGGRTSPPLGVTGGAVTSGAVVVVPAGPPPGGPSRSTWPTWITLTFSMLFQAASSR
jgi:hypothetical protein